MEQHAPHSSSSNGPEIEARQPQPVDGHGEIHDFPTDEIPALSKDVIFDLLCVERRRMALQYLRRNGPEVSLSTLATRLAAHENDCPVNAVSSDQRKRVYIALYQSHLPKLDDAGVVDFDARRGAVELADNASLLYLYLDLDSATERQTDGPSPFLALIRDLRARVPSVARHGSGDIDQPSA